MSFINLTAYLCASASAVALLAASPASAQAAGGAPASPPTQSAPATAATSGGTLEEIVVTAQRREERLVDVPISVASESGAQLKAAGIQSTLDLQQVVAGVLLPRFGGNVQPSIRGVSTRNTSVGAENNVAVYVDGFYIASGAGVNRGVADVQGIEVLKGPQGTLYGRNATGGAIIITTREPTQDKALYASASVEGLNGSKGELYGSMGITDNLAVSISATTERSDGWEHNTAPGFSFDTAPIKRDFASLKALYKPTDKISFLGWIETGYTGDGLPQAISYFRNPQNLGVQPILNPIPNTTNQSYPSSIRNLWNAAYLRSTFDLDWATLTSYTGDRKDKNKQKIDFDGSALTDIPTGGGRSYSPISEFSQEFVLNSNSKGPFTWILGANYYDNKSSSSSFRGNIQTVESDGTSWAAYGDATYRFGDSLFVTGGLRYSSEEKTCLIAKPNPLGPLLACPGGDNKISEHAMTPRAVIRYQLSDSSNVYASYNKGFKTGSFNSGTAAAPVQPEHVSSYEVGFKTSQRNWRFDTSVFYEDYQGIASGAYCAFLAPPACPIAGTSVFINAARSKIYGADAAYTLQVNDNLSLNAGIAYLHARFDSFPNASAFAPSNCSNPNSLLCPNVAVSQNWAGQQMIRSPDWSENVSANYKVPTTFGLFEFAGNVYYVSDYQPNNDHLPCNVNGCGQGLSPYMVAPAHTLADTTFTWTEPSKHWSVALYARNLFNKQYILQTDANAFGDWRVFGEPRVVGMRLAYNY